LLSSSLIQLVNVSKYNQKPLPVTEEVFDFKERCGHNRNMVNYSD